MFHLSSLLRDIGVDYIVVGDSRNDTFASVRSLLDARDGCLVFISRPGDQALQIVKNTVARVILLEKSWGLGRMDSLQELNRTVYLVDDPRYVIGLILRRTNPEVDSYPKGIHSTAIVHPEAVVHDSVHVGPYCIIEKCRIGGDSRILSHSVIMEGVEIGDRVTIREHCTLGSQGFGIARDRGTDRLMRIPHIGGTVVADDVELFPYVNVDRGTFGNTVIGRGTKVDHYVHVGHNVVIGEDCIITARATFCGKSAVGSRTWIGVGTVVKENVHVGSDCVTGLGSVVINDVPDGEIVAGVPARALKKKPSQ